MMVGVMLVAGGDAFYGDSDGDKRSTVVVTIEMVLVPMMLVLMMLVLMMLYGVQWYWLRS